MQASVDIPPPPAGPREGGEEVLSLHPEDNISGDDDAESIHSSWNFKRRQTDTDEGTVVSGLSATGSAEGAPLSRSEADNYVTLITKIIADLDISGAETVGESKSRIQSSRCKNQVAQAFLPLDDNHAKAIDKLWNTGGDVSIYKKVTKDRYKIVEGGFTKYLKVGRVADDYLIQELERSGVKVQAKSPKLPNKDLAPIERKVAHIEAQSQLGIACAVSQSWMLQYLTSKLQGFDKLMLETLTPVDYNVLSSKMDLASLVDVSILAQDAAMDALDLQAREAAEAKWIRRSLWVDQTAWPGTVKAAVKRFPIVGDGSICGPLLKEKLESYRLTSKALAATAAAAPKPRPAKRAFTQGSAPMGPPAKQRRGSYDARPRTQWRSERGGHGNPRQAGNVGRPRASFARKQESAQSSG